MERIIISESGREYTLTYNNSIDITIIMDCMTPEASAEEFEAKHIYFNFVDYIHGDFRDMEDEDILYYIDEYEKTLTIKGFVYEDDKQYEIYKGI